jgi:hypothetical protein
VRITKTKECCNSHPRRYVGCEEDVETYRYYKEKNDIKNRPDFSLSTIFYPDTSMYAVLVQGKNLFETKDKNNLELAANAYKAIMNK